MKIVPKIHRPRKVVGETGSRESNAHSMAPLHNAVS